MMRKLVGALSLAALMATSATAQSPFQQTFTVTGGNFPAVWNGKFSAGGNIGLTGELPNTSFEIWCVDPLQATGAGTVFTNAWITPLNTNPVNFTHTFAERTGEAGHTSVTGAAAETEYQKAAYLANKMVTTPGTFTINDYQEAIWQVMGYSGHNGSAANQIITNMGSSWTGIVAGEWGVITGGLNDQEFIYHRDTGTFLQTTPEPATMSLMAMGLAGMAGTSLRRRKRKQ